jgi:hypothetical protein
MSVSIRALAVTFLGVALAAAQQDSDELRIVVLSGEDGVNIVKDQTFAQTMVEIRDKNNLPIAGGVAGGLIVTFVVLRGGPGGGGSFANGGNQLAVTADANGRAVMTGFRPSGNGPVNIEVRAAHQGRTARTVVRQTNFPTVEAARAAGREPGNQQQADGNGPQQGNGNQAARQAAQQAGKGMSGAAKAALIGGVAAGGAGAAAYGAGLFEQKDSSDNGCSNADALQRAVTAQQQSLNACANSSPSNPVPCQNALRDTANLISQACACIGRPIPQQLLSLWQQVVAAGRDYGLSISGGSCN